MNADGHAKQLKALLPRGAAFNHLRPSHTLYKVLLGMADEFARVDARAEDLRRESIPATSSQMLPDWETALGLPDECETSIPFDVGTDSSGNGNDGTSAGSFDLVDTNSAFGTGIDFAQNSGMIWAEVAGIGNHAPFSIDFTVTPGALDGSHSGDIQDLVHYRSQAGVPSVGVYVYTYLTNDTGVLRVSVKTFAGSVVFLDSEPLVQGETYRVQICWQGTLNLRLFINGAFVTDADVVRMPVANGDERLVIGADPEYFGTCYSVIDEVRISSVERHNMDYEIETVPFEADANTTVLWHFDDFAERRIKAVQKLIARGGQSRAYFTELAAACGYTVNVINEFGPLVLRAGFLAGALCYGFEYAFAFEIVLEAPTGLALSHTAFECIIRRATHAHIKVIFTYL